jgi:hypothetical protein
MSDVTSRLSTMRFELWTARDDGRRYGVDHQSAGVPFEYTGAYLLGVDRRPLLDAPLCRTLPALLERFDDSDADVVGIATGEKGRLYLDDEQRTETFELFR